MKMTLKKSGRPFGTSAGQSGKGMMTAYTRNFTNSRTLKVSGKKATSNGVSQLKGRLSVTRGKWGQ